MADAAKQRGTSRLARTLRALAIIVGIGVLLTVWNAFNLRRDVSNATGPQSEAQKQFLVGAADRPDIAVFFKNLQPEQRLAMSRAIGQYDDPKLPTLVGKLLGDFDAEARKELTASLTKLVARHPKEVAEQLKEKGSFQQIGVFSALRSAGPAVLPLVAQQLAVGDARPGAVAYLVEQGNPSIPVLLPYLDDANNDVKLAAADALGKLRAREAVPKLVALYNVAEPDPKAQYLAALAGIGDPSQEGLMERILVDPSAPVAQRASAALGLGRIATSSAVATLWNRVQEPETAVRESAIAGLILAGDISLDKAAGTKADRLAVAAGLRSAKADAIVREALEDPALAMDAARAAAARPSLVPSLSARLERLDLNQEGDLADVIIESLSGSPEGETRLAALKSNPEIAALADRRG